MAKWKISHKRNAAYYLTNTSGQDFTNVSLTNEDNRFARVDFNHDGIDMDDGDSVPFLAAATMNSESDYVTVHWTDQVGVRNSKKVFL